MNDVLADLVTFARLEVEAADIEPWADVIGAMHRAGHLDREQALWAVKLYNAYDDLGSAWQVYGQWPTPAAWHMARDRSAATTYPCSRERRNLRGGKVVKHLDSYAEHLAGQRQYTWLTSGYRRAGIDPHSAFLLLMPHLRQVWGVGRQTAFEWAEFAAKVLGLPVETPDAQLWESSGPRESLQRLYGNDRPTLAWLNDRAGECRAMLAAEGVELSWWDFETVICDFNVMRKGRYYPGQHLAMIREEIAGLPEPYRSQLDTALRTVVPPAWADIPPGADKELARHYRDTGRIRTPLDAVAVGGPL